MKQLFCDCKTDEEKANFFLSGRAVETGIIAPAISNDVSMAYPRCAEFQKEIDTLRAKVARMERQVPICRAEDLKHAESLLPTLGLKPENPLYALPGAQQCKNCNGMGDRFDPSGEKIPCDLCESHLEEIRSLVAEAAHDIISGSDFWLSISLAAKKIYALPGAKGEEK